jgi:hypothetical protein
VAYIPHERVHVKTEVSFIAEDPWTGNARATFTIEDYIYVPKGSVERPDPKPPLGQDFMRYIRCGEDGPERQMPDSLSALWRDQQVPAEAIPRLMKEMKGSLEESDYEVMLHNKALVATWAVMAILPVYVVAMITWHMVIDPWGIPPAFGVPLMLGFCGFLGVFSHRVYFRKMSRRRRQKAWILSRL